MTLKSNNSNIYSNNCAKNKKIGLDIAYTLTQLNNSQQTHK